MFKIVGGAILAMIIFLAVAPRLFFYTYSKNPTAAWRGAMWSMDIWRYVMGAIIVLVAGYAYREFVREYAKQGKKLPWWLRLHARLLTGRKLETLIKNVPPDEEEKS